MEETIRKLKSMAEDEFKDIINKGHMNPMDVDMSTRLLCLIEKADLVMEEEGYSSRRRSMRSSMYPHDSYSDGRDSYAYGDNSYRDDRNYSTHSIKDRMVDKLEQMMSEAKTDHEKDIVNKWIDRISRD
jgi:hypothetical protein